MSCFRDDVMAGRVALVTGGGTGIGKEIARTLGAHGARLAIASRRQEVLEAAREEFEAEGLECLAVPCDVRRPDEVETVMRAVMERYGKLDVVVNNAAGNFPAPISGISPNGFKAVVDIDLLGTYNVSRAAFDAWLGEHGGDIVNISAPFEGMGAALQAHVAAAKSGVDSLTRTCAVEWGPRGIRVNAVAPGFIDGSWLAEGFGAAYEGIKNAVQERTPLKRVCQPDDVAHAIVGLIRGPDLVTGHVLPIEGGALIAG